MKYIQPQHFNGIVDIMGNPYMVRVGMILQNYDGLSSAVQRLVGSSASIPRNVPLILIAEDVSAEELKRLYDASIALRRDHMGPALLDPSGVLHKAEEFGYGTAPDGWVARVSFRGARWGIAEEGKSGIVVVTPRKVSARTSSNDIPKLDDLVRFATKNNIPIDISQLDYSDGDDIFHTDWASM